MRRLALIALLGGCTFSPDLPPGAILCGPSGSCPPGLSCADDGICRDHKSDAAPDPPDAGTHPDACHPLTCADISAQCGQLDDGCGHRIDCGSCHGKQVCSNHQCVKMD